MSKAIHRETEQRSDVRRQEVTGEVISNKMDKTIRVQIYRSVRHSKYGKFQKRTSIYICHDEKNVAKIGDKVRIQATRPLSKTKRWRLLEVVEAAEPDIGSINA